MNNPNKNQVTENGQIKDEQALVQSAGDSDGISTSPETKEEIKRKKRQGHNEKNGLEKRSDEGTSSTADPATGREWIKH